ncbi:hypothetical protein EXIGLDRAFT_667492 [Exidia glandulosa HHB12029]|uniref:DDHD domain-containing protein n=1 Tax=Exidia glandulosa HHB12029 TaxID=1314781 RepID=A0A165NA07_EXIGL|nr:hypothetical protein EXIGLDRAFT_667492 [Exidia glandulosa HHB12029]
MWLPTTRDDDELTPDYVVRWLRPHYATALLDLPSAPVALSSADHWHAFSEEESAACEEAWMKLPDGLRLDSGDANDSPTSEDFAEQEDDVVGVAIYKDMLYEVDVRFMQLKPVYWRRSGKPIPVMRAHWMFDQARPVPEPLNSQLERAYRETQPWRAAYAHVLNAALDAGPDAYSQFKIDLQDSKRKQSVFFQDHESARIISDNIGLRIQQSIYSSFSSANASIPFPYATPVYRGYDAAARAAPRSQRPSFSLSRSTSPLPSRAPTPPRSPGPRVPHSRDTSLDIPIRPPLQRGRTKDDEVELVHTDLPSKTGEEDDGEVTDLVFMIHGIGQQAATQFESMNWVYATNLFRQIVRKQSTKPELASIMRAHRIQFLPIEWRSTFAKLMERDHRRDAAGPSTAKKKNKYTLADITLKDNVAFARELFNNVILDLPLFMSRHKDHMMQAVCLEANAVYRKWCARHPGFDESGRVHIVAHSIGSVLISHVLSSQPTWVPPLCDRPLSERRPDKQLLFNTGALFMAGSPLAMFMSLDQSTLIARKGRERTRHPRADESMDAQGVFGCLAVDSIYNVFYQADIIAYRANPVVDSKRAMELPPTAIASINASLLGRVTKAILSVPSFFTIPQFSLASPFGSKAPSRAPSPDRPERDRGKRRFAALNPHGTLDFYLPSEGFSEYIDMVTAHMAYWSDSSFASFVLAEIFADQEH